MSQRRSTLAQLREELRYIDVFDRIHDYATDADPVSERAYALRQLRRKQILDDIERLKVSKSELANSDWVSRAVVLVWAFSCAMLYFLFK